VILIVESTKKETAKWKMEKGENQKERKETKGDE